MNDHITKPLLNIKGTYLRKRRRSKTMNSKMITDSQISTTESKKRKRKRKQNLSKQLEQDQNQRNGHHMEGFHWGGEGEEW